MRSFPSLPARLFKTIKLNRRALREAFLLVVLLFGAALVSTPGSAIEEPADRLSEIGISPELGAELSLTLPFISAEGTALTLGDLIGTSGRPSIIVPVYYKCPRLCGLLMGGFTSLLKDLTLSLGSDFQVIVFSISPTETVEDAAAAKLRYADLAGLTSEQRSSFHFLVGQGESINQLTKDVGFKYLPDGEDFAHSAGLILVTPSGRVSQYFTGIEFHPFDTRLALVEASEGKIGTALDHVMLYCFRFDPLKGKYTWVMTGALRIGGVLTLILLGGLIGGLILRERRRQTPKSVEVS